MIGGGVSVLVADASPDFRELLVNHLLMSGVERIAVATGAGELIGSLPGADYDLIVVSSRIFGDERAKASLRRFREAQGGAIIVLLEEANGEPGLCELKAINAPVYVPRSSASKMIRRIVSG